MCFSALIFVFMASTFVLAAPLSATAPNLSQSERDYFLQNKILRVLTVENCQPYFYNDSKNPSGVSVDILNLLCEASGTSLEFVTAENSTQAALMLENGEADVSAVKFTVGEHKQGFVPYLRAPLHLVYNEQSLNEDISSLTIAQLDNLNFLYSDKYEFVTDTHFSTVQECLNSVRSRKADIFLCDAYQLSVYSESFAARGLSMMNVPQREITVGFEHSPTADIRLISALQRVVDSFSTAEMNTSLITHKYYHNLDFNLVQLIYKHPFEFLCAISSLFFVILLCLFVSHRIRSGQRQELRGYEDSYRMLAETFGEAGMEYDFLNDRLTVFGGGRDRLDIPQTTCETRNALKTRSLRLSLSPSDLDVMLSNNAPGRSYETELQCGMKDGGWNWFRMIYIVVCTSESHRRPIRLIGCLINIEQEHLEKERLLKSSLNDYLTGILNRAAAEKEIKTALSVDAERKLLLFLDIDNFKSFNDLFGHSCGDAVLTAMSQAMRNTFPPDAILSRWGGDEFLVLLRGDILIPERLNICLKKLQDAMHIFSYMKQALPVTLSIGGVESSESSSFNTLFELADAALYEVKNKGRNSFHVVYSQAPDEPSKTEDVL